MRILVTGSRCWTDREAMERALWELIEDQDPHGVVIIHGGARGADAMARAIAKDWGLYEKTVPALWAQEGRAAGPIRNQQMVDMNPDVCLAFPCRESKGTWDCMARAERAGIKVVNRGWTP